MSLVEDRKGWRAAGRSLEAVKAFCAERDRVRSMWDAFAAEFGAEVMPGRSGMRGLIFDGDPPEMLRDDLRLKWCSVRERDGQIVNTRYWEGSTRTKAGKKLRKRMRDLDSMPGSWALDAAIRGARGSHMAGSCVWSVGFMWVGDMCLLTDHKTALPPLDAEPLKWSEYFGLIESADD
ncbi:MAG: hypothetical protein ACI9K2_006635 [Myxococcota bacterium]|jgi:hypothetical protein